MSQLVRKASAKAASKLKRSMSVDARRSKSMVPRIPRTLKPEPKFVDYAFSGGSIVGGTPGVTLISGVGTGTDYTDRIGRKVQWKSLRIRFSVYQSTTATLATVRVLVVCDRNNQGAVPNASEIVANTASSETATNFANRERFRVLLDEYLPNIGNQNDNVGIIDRFVKIKEELAQFLNTASTIASQGAGAIFLLVMSDQTITSASGTGDSRAGYSIWTRIGFYDV